MTTLLLALAILLQPPSGARAVLLQPPNSALAGIIAGEAPACPVEAKLAIAQVHANRLQAGVQGGWFGSRQPAAIDRLVAATWRLWPDLTQGALYAIGPGDQRAMPWLQQRIARWDCAGGDFVEVWR